MILLGLFWACYNPRIFDTSVTNMESVYCVNGKFLSPSSCERSSSTAPEVLAAVSTTQAGVILDQAWEARTETNGSSTTFTGRNNSSPSHIQPSQGAKKWLISVC